MNTQSRRCPLCALKVFPLKCCLCRPSDTMSLWVRAFNYIQLIIVSFCQVTFFEMSGRSRAIGLFSPMCVWGQWGLTGGVDGWENKSLPDSLFSLIFPLTISFIRQSLHILFGWENSSGATEGPCWMGDFCFLHLHPTSSRDTSSSNIRWVFFLLWR